MDIRTPRLEIYPKRIGENARLVIDSCHGHGASVACVSKVSGGHAAVVQAMISGGADMIAESRTDNLRSIAESGVKLPLMLLRIPTPSQALEVVRWSDYSLNSSLRTLELLSEAAGYLKIRHKALIMVDVGDLREGLWPDQVIDVVREAARLSNLEVVGLGTNLACFGGVIPSVENMQLLVDVRNSCRRATGLELGMLSGGNSANLPLLKTGEMPAEINHFRIGEAIVLGRNVLDRSPWPGTRQDTFRIVAEVIEVGHKPSLPIGRRAQDAFGGFAEFVDRGVRRRAICNIGRQDLNIEGISPEDGGILVLGGSSDHIVLDVEDASRRIELGDELAFLPAYGALLGAFTSRYVQKVVVQE